MGSGLDKVSLTLITSSGGNNDGQKKNPRSGGGFLIEKLAVNTLANQALIDGTRLAA